jgi:uncharacterized membrane protein YbhN (UPF0104 family)
VAAAWSGGTLVLTVLALAAQVRQHGWEGLAAPANLLPALALATASYLLRFLRWHVLARRLAPDLSARVSFVLSTIGFALIMTPGRGGETLKLFLLRQRTAVPIATSAPVFVLEKASEAIALASLAIGASLLLPWSEAVQPASRWAFPLAALLALAVAVTLRHRLVLAAARLPLLRRLLARPGAAQLWQHLVTGSDRLLGWTMVLQALGLSLLARLCDGLAIVLVAGLYGLSLPPAAGWFLIGSSGFLGGISMVPGGAGVAEAAMIAGLLALGAGPATAVATTLTSRLLIFWLWVALGLGLAIRYAAGQWQEPPAEPTA